MNLARSSIRKPVTTVMFMLAVILVGAVSFTRLDMDLLPDLNPPVAAVITQFPGASAQEVQDLVTLQVEAVAGTAPGVAAVELLGGADKRINVWLDPAKLAANGLTQDSVAAMIGASNLNYPLGDIRNDGLSLQLRMIGKYGKIEDVGETIVGYAPVAGNGQSAAVPKPVLLKDVAKVEEGYAETTSITRVNGKSGVTLAIHREGTANTVSVSRAVKKELDKISDNLGIDVSTSMDQARFIEFAVRAIENNLLIGAGLAVLVLLLFLRDFRTTLVISISIPFSLIATFMLLHAGKLSLNIMTLGGLALGVGMLVDNSIVVIENIFRHTQEGEDPRTAAEAGTQEVAMAITASTLTTVIVFLPVVFVGGITGIIFKQLAWTVTFSLLASLVVALTVVPMLASRIFGRKKEGKGARDQSKPMREGGYASAVRWSLRNRALILIVVFAMLGGTVFLTRKIPSEFLPVADEGSFTMDLSVKPGTTLEDVDKVVGAIEGILAKEKSVDSYSVTIGQPGEVASFQSSVTGGSDAQILVTVTKAVSDKKETADFMESLEKKVDKVRGEATIAYNMTSSLMMMAGDLPSQVQVQVSGPDAAEVGRLASDLVDRMKDVDGLRNVKSSLTETKPEVHLTVDKEKALRFGLTGDLVLQSRAGKVLVKDVAKIETGAGPLVISRLDRRLSARVTGQISGRSLGSVSSDVSDIIDGMDFPDGYQAELGGVSEIMSEGFSSLNLALGLAAILVYMVMAASFESVGQPMILMLTMPLAAVGAVLGLYLGNCAFGITAFIGVIILAGVVVNNGIVMVDFMNQLMASGVPLTEAIVEGASRRLRPVLMTSLTTIVGLIPMALGIGEGGELEAPLALALMGGLTSSTFLTLFVIPVVYSIITRERRAPQVSRPSQIVVDGQVTVSTPATSPSAVSRTEASPELLLGPAFDSKDMADLVELLGKLFSSVRRKSV